MAYRLIVPFMEREEYEQRKEDRARKLREIESVKRESDRIILAREKQRLIKKMAQSKAKEDTKRNDFISNLQMR